MENQVINVEEKKNLIELKYKVLSQRIDRLYDIFIVLSQDSEHAGKLRAIEVIKEQYKKMYKTILEREEFEKYEEVENTIIPKLAQIEHELDRHIYRTSRNCEELFDTYIKEIEKYDNYNNLAGELEKIKGLKELLKLYRPYISQEQEERLRNKISELKYDLALRRKIKEMHSATTGLHYSILSQCDSKEERAIFERLTQERFMWYINGYLREGMSKKEKDAKIKDVTGSIMEFGGVLYVLLKDVIVLEIEKHKTRIDKTCRIIKLLYKIEKVNGKTDLEEELNTIQLIKERFNVLNEAIENKQYDKYLEIRAEIIPVLEEIERKLDEYVKGNPDGIKYILDTVHSKKYNSYALLEKDEADLVDVLNDVIKLYIPFMTLIEEERLDIIKEIESRKKLRAQILQSKRSWREYKDIMDKIDAEFLMGLPVFDNSVVNFGKLIMYIPGNRKYIDWDQEELSYLKCGYFEDLVENEQFSLIDMDALEFFWDRWHRRAVYSTEMNHAQNVVWELYQNIHRCEEYFLRRYRKDAYYLIELDEETDMYINTDLFERENYWPIGGKQFYKIPNFQYIQNSKKAKKEFKWLGVKTKKFVTTKKQRR